MADLNENINAEIDEEKSIEEQSSEEDKNLNQNESFSVIHSTNKGEVNLDGTAGGRSA